MRRDKPHFHRRSSLVERTPRKDQLRVSVYPYPDYGTLTGAVIAIAPDAIAPQTNDSSLAAPYYEMTLQPERLYLEKSGRHYPIQPGMEVTADIIPLCHYYLIIMTKEEYTPTITSVNISPLTKSTVCYPYSFQHDHISSH